MDLGMYEKDLINIRLILEQTEQIDHQTIIEKYRNYSRKGAITCPFCGEKLKLRAGEIRDIHFSHPVGKTCMKAKAYDTYQRQTFRENEKHSVMKEIIYTELKGQERFKNDLKVEYGYLEKAEEKWNIYPDIYLKKGDREFALNIITNIQQIGDEKVVNNIHRRNSYFKNKGLEIIWFIEERELADDFVNRVLHLWEAEYNLAMKTREDHIWDEHIRELSLKYPEYKLPEVFGYKSQNEALPLEVHSLYYIRSLQEGMEFTVHRLILDNKIAPFRAFALTKSYPLKLSYALSIDTEISLSDKEQENLNRKEFEEEFIDKINNQITNDNYVGYSDLSEFSFSSVNFNPYERTVISDEATRKIIQEDELENKRESHNPDYYLKQIINFTITDEEARHFYEGLASRHVDLATHNLRLDNICNAIESFSSFCNNEARVWLDKILRL